MIVGMAFRHATNLGLVLTSFDYRYELSACYKFMDGLTKIFNFRSNLSGGHFSRADIIAIYDGRKNLPTCHVCRPGPYNKL
jgi:hypothetical protein